MSSTETKPENSPPPKGDYRSDRQWSDAYLPAVRQIIGPMLLIPAPMERDVSEATDLIVLKARDMTIGVRIRREGYGARYPGQFTIRAKRDNGMKTELRKIIEGWGDWLFYGHASGPEAVNPWVLVDLHMLRALFIGNPKYLHEPDDVSSGNKYNGDGTHFMWFDINHLPKEIIVGKSS